MKMRMVIVNKDGDGNYGATSVDVMEHLYEITIT